MVAETPRPPANIFLTFFSPQNDSNPEFPGGRGCSEVGVYYIQVLVSASYQYNSTRAMYSLTVYLRIKPNHKGCAAITVIFSLQDNLL